MFVFDGLRPDRVDPARMPRLAALAAGGARWVNARTVFPSETRVAAASLVTGAWPGSHGLIGNDFLDPTVFADRAVATKDRADLEAVERRAGALLARPSLGERLAAAGMRFAVVSSASAGTSYILDHRAAADGRFVWSVHGVGNAPAEEAAAIAARFGPVPPVALPNAARVAHAGLVLVEHVLPRLRPDFALFWSNEPDHAYHGAGLASPEAAAAESAADAVLGAVLDWRAAQPDGDAIQIIVASDHGHVTGTRRVDLAARFAAAGLGPGVGVRLVPGSAGFVHLDPAMRDASRVADWLAGQPWCGLVFAVPGVAGSLPLDALRLGHRRRPDLVFTLAGDDAPRPGAAGASLFDADLPEGGGVHGGLRRAELATVLLAGGSAFRAAAALEHPAGIVDIAPTVLTLLGLPVAGCDGRVLGEGLCGDGIDAEFCVETLECDANGVSRKLARWHAGGHAYLAGALT
jgi:hypothetical protein